VAGRKGGREERRRSHGRRPHGIVRVVADKRRGRAGASGEKEGEWDGGTTPDEGTRHGYSSWREVLRAPPVSNVENYLSLDDAPFRPWRSPPFPRARAAPLCSRFISRGRAQVATDRVFIGARSSASEVA